MENAGNRGGGEVQEGEGGQGQQGHRLPHLEGRVEGKGSGQ